MTGKAARSPAYWRYAGTENAASVYLRGPAEREAAWSVSVGCAPGGPGQRNELRTRDTSSRRCRMPPADRAQRLGLGRGGGFVWPGARHGRPRG